MIPPDPPLLRAAAVIIGYLMLFNALTALLFFIDKRAAIKAKQRVPERVLLFMAAFGGTIGAKYAQRRFRHKTYKQPFGSRLNAIGYLQIALILLMVWLSVVEKPDAVVEKDFADIAPKRLNVPVTPGPSSPPPAR